MNTDFNADLKTSLNNAEPQRVGKTFNQDSPVPLHHQVRNFLLGCIERGELLPSQTLLQEREFATHFGISLAHIRQAILDLVKEGYLYLIPDRGTFVREQKGEEKISILSSFTESIRAKGINALRVIELRVGKAPSVVGPMLQTPDQQFVSFLLVARSNV